MISSIRSTPSASRNEDISGIGTYEAVSPASFSLSMTISAWKIFCSMRSSKLSATAPTNMPCERLEIFEAGIRLSSCVLVEVVRLSLLSELEVRSCTILPKRSLNVLAVSPKT